MRAQDFSAFALRALKQRNPTPRAIELGFRKYGLLLNGSIESVDLSGPFDSTAAEVVRVEINFTGTDLDNMPRSAFAKIFRGEGILSHGRTELKFFTDIVPYLKTNIAPQLYAFWELEDTLVLLMEDLTAIGTKEHIVLTSQCLDIIPDAVAQFHSIGWNSSFLRHPSFGGGRAIATKMQIASLETAKENNAFIQPLITNFLRTHQRELTLAEIDVLNGLSKNWFRVFSERIQNSNLTLIHGDFHLLGNIFFIPSNNQIRVIDWADTKVGLGAHDLAYCLLSTTAEDRRDRDSKLMKRYLDCLLANGVRDYDWLQLKFDYRLALLNNLLQSVSQNSLRWYRRTFEVVQIWTAEEILSS